jgi:Na+/H+ antiporter NhaD/arsenite permease-like protein
VSAGICAKQGERITFVRLLRFGLPVTLPQLAVATLYVIAMVWFAG